MKIKVSELMTVLSNLQHQKVDLLKLRDKINNLLSMTDVSTDLATDCIKFSNDCEEVLYEAYVKNEVETLHEALLLENEIQDIANEMESSAIYSHIITGKDYPEALYAIKYQIDPEHADDEPPIFYSSELDYHYESYGDPMDYVLGYTTSPGSPNTMIFDDSIIRNIPIRHVP